jgi:beta-phosphoglucomutase-like phosphatase (HAD superfamily)
MAELKLVIFDCDGVMFDSKDANRKYYNHLLKKFGYPLMDGQEEDYVHSHNVLASVAYIFRKYPHEIDKVNAYRQSVDYTPFLNFMRIEPDLKEFLRFLKPQFYTAISTNRSTTMDAVMKMHELDPYFDLVVTSLDVQQPKPHAEALLKILSHFATAWLTGSIPRGLTCVSFPIRIRSCPLISMLTAFLIFPCCRFFRNRHKL